MSTPTPITEPGVYDITDAEYHADPIEGGSLSSSELKKLADCPARYRQYKDAPPVYKKAFSFGHAAHAKMLGRGTHGVTVKGFTDWKKKAAQQARAEILEAGGAPMLEHDWDNINGMYDALQAHPVARGLLNGETGKAEQSAFFDIGDGMTGRARFDWLPDVDGDRLVIPDYKTTGRTCDTRSFVRQALDFGYHQQDAWYSDAAAAVLDVAEVSFVFIVQETSAPYLVNVVQLSNELKLIGAERNTQAVRTYRECTASGEWPGYIPAHGRSVDLGVAPAWASYQHEENRETWGLAS
jgi:hypothetical protein